VIARQREDEQSSEARADTPLEPAPRGLSTQLHARDAGAVRRE
jgi:hypothetical protein